MRLRRHASTSPDDATISVILRSLAERYAQAVDRGDADLLISVFHPDAYMEVYRGVEASEPGRQMSGHADLAQITGRVSSRYARTYHLIGNCTYQTDGRSATGEVYCIAHHLTFSQPTMGLDYVMYIRYQDKYREDDELGWKIQDRRLVVDWTELRTANPAGV